jgi:translation initiation factor 1
MKLKGLDELRRLLPSDGSVAPPSLPATANRGHDGKGSTVRVTLETNGRKGKAVTMISGLRHNPQTMEEIARILKQHCGAGGTVKSGAIEIQGDQRERVRKKLEEMHYVVK